MSTPVKRLRPSSTQRMALLGTTGCGKTTLARHLLANAPYETILIVDSKCTYGGKNGEEGYKMVRSPRELYRCRKSERRIQYRPDEFHQAVEHYDEVYKWAYRRGRLLVYTDETFLVMRRSYAPDWLRACVTCGRELGIGMIFGSQRPRGIDLRVLTEAEVIACFELRHKDDRKRVAEMIGEAAMISPPKHAFHFWKTGMKEPVMMRLKL